MTFNHIELFAGCGGMTLGLESEDFNLVFANELSPMAGETFAYNLLKNGGDNLRELAENNQQAQKTFWLNSRFPANELSQRLRENPKAAPAQGKGFNDLDERGHELKGGLVIGDIITLNNYLCSNPQLLRQIKTGFGKGLEGSTGVDLVSGGPPCQSFSMAGLRQHDNERNQLPWEFARFVELVQPRAVVLENVSGILHAFNVAGKKHFAWFEVAKAFAAKGYVPICLHINAKYVGVAQNRPRFIMLALREDVFSSYLSSKKTISSQEILQQSFSFYRKARQGEDLAFENTAFTYLDSEKDRQIFTDSFLRPFVEIGGQLSLDEVPLRTVEDAIDDLRASNKNPQQGRYVEEINSLLGNKLPPTPLNHGMRKNSAKVVQRFSLYQAITQVSPQTKKQVAAFLRTDNASLITETTVAELARFPLLDRNLLPTQHDSKEELVTFLRSLVTKKQTQRAMVKGQPAPAALSIPDDICHYHPEELRTLSVREMARIQSFPDGFELRSKVTTGGQMRKYEVPQYTQVGNAVPPLLGKAIGKVVRTLLLEVDETVKVIKPEAVAELSI